MSTERSVWEFTRQAASFEAPGSHFADAGVLDWIAARVAVRSGDRILDVAGGTGQLARHLARTGRLCVVADITPAMLEQGARAAREQGRDDVVFVRADATDLPFPDAQYEVVVSRFALHHLAGIEAVLDEMRRVLAPGGSVTLIDIVAEAGPVGERTDELERLRDPSHIRCLRPTELAALLADRGLRVAGEATRDERLEAKPWLDRAHSAAEAHVIVLEALRAEAAGGAPTGLRAAQDDGTLTITHRYHLIHATRG